MERQVPTKVPKTQFRVRPPQAKPEQSHSAPHPLFRLQRSIGNRAVQRLIKSPYIQAKLQVSTPEDPSEQEADRMADTVMRMTLPEGEPEEEKEQVATKPLVQRAALAVREDEDEEEGTTVQRMCTDCEEEKDQKDPVVHRKAATESQSDDEGEDEQVQAHADGATAPTLTPSVAANVHAMNGGGSPLPKTTRAFFEPRFGADFSNVRIHTDARAEGVAKSINAKAFTVQRNIAFGAGQYRPESADGQRLLAHELTHVLQQGGEQTQSRPATGAARQKQPVHFLAPKIQRQDVPPVDHLTSLNEMLDRINVPEEDVLSLLPQLTDPEKVTVTTDASYKTRMASAFNTSEMLRAVRILPLTLEKQLEWLGAATSPSRIDYSEIQSLITSAPDQAQRDALKTNTWRTFFVDVCTNETIITAVTDLHFDLETQLQWIEEEASPSNLDYSQIQPLITAASQPDRDRLKTNRWRDFFVGVCTNATIITAVTDLHFDLLTQLEWIKEEASPSRLDYSQIQPFIVAASQPDKDALKTDTWRDFFVGVCTNATIMTALDDLNFDQLTTIRWLLEEAAVSNVDFTWLCNRFKAVNAFPPGEDAIACAIMERDIRDGTFDSSPDHTPAGWIIRAHNQLLVANEMGAMVGGTATWRGSGPTSGTTFQIWASAAVQGPVPALNALTVINCWEMIMLAAFRAGVLSWARIHTIYTTGSPNWGAFLVNQLSFSNRIPYNPARPTARPVAGDIVFFDGAAHVALGKGTVDGLGRTEIYSFWPPPNTAFTAGGTIDDVKITTIEQLNTYWVGRGQPAFTIEFATPNWG